MEFGAAVPGDLYAGYVVDDSDLEYSGCSAEESSDDEQLARESGSEYHPRKYSSHEDNASSSEDDFEKEMASEVLSALKVMATPSLAGTGSGGVSHADASGVKLVASSSFSTAAGSRDQSATVASPEYYDDVYFDSDSSEDEGGGGAGKEGAGLDADGESSEGEGLQRKVGKKVRKLTNEELFYDPNMDEEDEKWIRRRRMAYHNVEVSRKLEQKKSMRKPPREGQDKAPRKKESERSQKKEESLLPKSDAVLNCPACMVALCLDCQRHEVYKNQYRAMFVINCRVQKDEILKHIPKQKKSSRKRRRKGGQAAAMADCLEEAESSYHPVRCTECNTEVAVIDSDEVFHFFNVLASVPN